MTRPQQKALHLAFTKLADTLNDAGLTVEQTLRQDFSINWTGELIKELIWRPIQKAMYDIESTTQIDTKQINSIYDEITINIAEKLGVEVDLFPSWEELVKEIEFKNKKNAKN